MPFAKQSFANLQKKHQKQINICFGFSQKQMHMFCLVLHTPFDIRTQVHTKKNLLGIIFFGYEKPDGTHRSFERDFWLICIWKVNKAVDRELVFHVANESHFSSRPLLIPPEEHYRRFGSMVSPQTPLTNPKYFGMATWAVIALCEETCIN